MSEKNYNVKVMYTEEEVLKRIKEMGEQISKDYGDQPIKLISVLKGGAFITCELAKRITTPPVSLDFMSLSSYQGTTSTGVVKIIKDLDHSIDGENVIGVEDIIDTGRTLSYLMKYLANRNPKSIKLCTLLDKPDRRVVDDVKVDYTGFVIPDEFVVGWGLDYDQKMRNLPFIGTVEFID